MQGLYNKTVNKTVARCATMTKFLYFEYEQGGNLWVKKNGTLSVRPLVECMTQMYHFDFNFYTGTVLVIMATLIVMLFLLKIFNVVTAVIRDIF